MSLNTKNVAHMRHHHQQEVCQTRPRYRQGRRETAVKVYTIHQESKYLIIQGVPAIGVQEELHKSLSEYGEIVSLHPLHEYPCEQFTEVYLVQYAKLQSAKFAKRKLDDRTWYGSPIHVCYAPEYESVQDTKYKLRERQMSVLNAVKSGNFGCKNGRFRNRAPVQHQDEPVASTPEPSNQPTTYIWAGKEYPIPQPVVNDFEDVSRTAETESTDVTTSTQFVPRQLASKHRIEENPPGTSANIASKLLKVSAPNLEVSFKRKKLKTCEN